MTALNYREAELNNLLDYLAEASTPDQAFEVRNKILEVTHRDRGNTNALKGYIHMEGIPTDISDESDDEVINRPAAVECISSGSEYEPNHQAGDSPTSMTNPLKTNNNSFIRSHMTS